MTPALKYLHTHYYVRRIEEELRREQTLGHFYEDVNE